MGSKHLGALDHWLANIRDVYRQHAGELAKIKDEEQRHRRLVELNVGEQVDAYMCYQQPHSFTHSLWFAGLHTPLTTNSA